MISNKIIINMNNWFVKFIFNLFHYIIIQNCCFPKKEEIVEINDKTAEVGDKSNNIQCKIKEKIILQQKNKIQAKMLIM